MQPRDVQEIHIIFKTRVPPGLDKVQNTGGSSSNVQQQQELQKIKNMLQSPIYLVKLVGTVDTHNLHGDQTVTWSLEFKDTPEVAKQPISTRLVSRVALEDGNITSFLDLFGFEYVLDLTSLDVYADSLKVCKSIFCGGPSILCPRH